jgi:hypothetical protein
VVEATNITSAKKHETFIPSLFSIGEHVYSMSCEWISAMNPDQDIIKVLSLVVLVVWDIGFLILFFRHITMIILAHVHTYISALVFFKDGLLVVI